jgi:hypothetical protein
MKLKPLTLIILTNLAVLLGLVFFAPQLMVSPGKLTDAHGALAKDCFACHSPFVGATADKCTVCHKVADIGLKTTQGVAIDKEHKAVAFHQHLTEADCIACHSEHRGVQPFRPVGRFSHELLQPAVQQQCEGCHRKPGDALHRKISDACGQCHTPERWKPATFDHERYFRLLLEPTQQRECDGCHRKPDDGLHQQISGNCGQCHSQERWKPATFDHDRYFRFDRHHTTECITCHVNNDYGSYTCYGCHEHSRSGIRAEHQEEGIYDYENCVDCHRSGDEDEAEYRMRSGRSGGEGSRAWRRERDDD